MTANSAVKVMQVLRGEHVACAYCGVSVKKRGVMVRMMEDRESLLLPYEAPAPVLKELLFFCSQGCGLAHVTDVAVAGGYPDGDSDPVSM